MVNEDGLKGLDKEDDAVTQEDLLQSFMLLDRDDGT